MSQSSESTNIIQTNWTKEDDASLLNILKTINYTPTPQQLKQLYNKRNPLRGRNHSALRKRRLILQKEHNSCIARQHTFNMQSVGGFSDVHTIRYDKKCMDDQQRKIKRENKIVNKLLSAEKPNQSVFYILKYSNDMDKKLKCLQQLYDKHKNENNDKKIYSSLIQDKIIDEILNISLSNSTKLQIHAFRILTLLSSKSSNICIQIVHWINSSDNAYYKLLANQPPTICNQILIIIGNIIGDIDNMQPKDQNVLIDESKNFLHYVSSKTSQNIGDCNYMYSLSWTLCNICKKCKSSLNVNDLKIIFGAIQSIMDLSCKTLNESNTLNSIDSVHSKIVQHCVWSMYFLTNNEKYITDIVQLILNDKMMHIIIEYMFHEIMNIRYPIIMMIGNILTINEHKPTTKCIEYGILDQFKNIVVKYNDNKEYKEILLSIYNISVGPLHHVVAIKDSGLIPVIMNALKDEQSSIAKEGILISHNIINLKRDELNSALSLAAFIPNICYFLSNVFCRNTPSKLILKGLECVEQILAWNPATAQQFGINDMKNILINIHDKLDDVSVKKITNCIHNEYFNFSIQHVQKNSASSIGILMDPLDISNKTEQEDDVNNDEEFWICNNCECMNRLNSSQCYACYTNLFK